MPPYGLVGGKGSALPVAINCNHYGSSITSRKVSPLSTAMAAMSRQEIEAVLVKRAAIDVLLFDAEGKRLYLSSKV